MICEQSVFSPRDLTYVNNQLCVCGNASIRRQIEKLTRCEIISEEQVKRLCLKAREILVEEGNVQVIDSPVTVRDVEFMNTETFL